ncbi:MAG: AarF/ABC1/UbiB kinase family protein [Deltaproteobacteria bacterium]|nr:MAG: AarF/ABC1/UbiB kinase family protein [Deltaproteobacteria bacterium]
MAPPASRAPAGRVTDCPRPTPRSLPRPTGRQLRRRALQTVRVAARHFRRLAARRLLRRPAPDDAFARPLRRTFEELGGTFVKFGQLVASAPGIFGDLVSREFRSCLDTGPAVPLAEVRAAIEGTTGRRLEDTFATFEETPIGRASIAVVHRARLHDGRLVAVKVLRPAIELSVATDLRLMKPLLDFLSRQVGVAAAGQLVRALDGFRQQVAEELDLRNEARAMVHYRELLQRCAHHGVPRRRPDRRSPAHRGAGHRSTATGRAERAGLVSHHDPLGRLPRRRARRQPARAARRPHRRHRLGHHGAARPRHTASFVACSRRRSATRPPGTR